MFKVYSVFDENWDKFVVEMGCSDIYYDRMYYKSLSAYTKSPIFLLTYNHNGAYICKIVQMNDISSCKYFENKIKKDTIFDLETPYGYGGVFSVNATEEDMQSFSSVLRQWAMKNGVVSEFIRFNPLLSNEGAVDKDTKVLKMKSTVFIDLTVEDLFGQLTSKNRNMVRKAIKSGVTIHAMEKHNEDYIKSEFIRLYKETMDRNNADDFYYFTTDYFNQFFQDMKDKYMILYAQYEGKVISASIFMYDNENMHYYLSGADRTYMNLAPNNLLLYEAAMIGKKRGLKAFHLGGGVSDNDALFSFKRSFNPNGVLDFHIGRAIYNQKMFDYLVAQRKTSPRFNEDKPFLIKYRQEEENE